MATQILQFNSWLAQSLQRDTYYRVFCCVVEGSHPLETGCWPETSSLPWRSARHSKLVWSLGGDWPCVRARSEPGDAREGKWRGNWRMEWVASTLTPPPNVVYPTLLKLMRTPRLPAVDWTDALTDLNGLVRFGERRNLFSARVPSRSARALQISQMTLWRHSHFIPKVHS